MITVEEVQSFIHDAKKFRDQWLFMADKSWAELKRRQKNSRLWSTSNGSLRRRARYPAWYSINQIRKPLILSRVGIPVGRDTTQEGTDNIGSTAAICKERLAKSLAKSFGFLDVLEACRDDFLATDFSTVRAYYERDTIKQKVKEYLTTQKDETGEVVFLDGAGDVVMSDDISQDDEGFFIEHEQIIEVDDERVCLEHVLGRQFLVDPGVKSWARCKRIAFEEFYSEREFIDLFGQAAFSQLPKPQPKDGDDATPKLQNIKVYEYWDLYDKETYWIADLGKTFLTPKGYDEDSDAKEDEKERNGIYDLEKFWPVPPPLIQNAPTDEFWPVCEYFQLVEILEDIHTIFSRMVACTKAIRARLLFDNNVEGLQEALNEATEGDAFGVPNLAQALAGAGGTLSNVVQYIPVEKLVESLGNLYGALDQRLSTLYRLTGTSDLLQGQQADSTARTYGEQQLKEKYALNQLATPQRKMQEFVRDCYELMCEMALKNFKDASLDKYIMPQTLQPDDQERYRAAVEMLKQDNKRFRIELETDSTIALNEEYDKAMRVELVNAMTAALEKTASMVDSSPSLVKVNLEALKFLVQGFRQGKLFQSEITEAIDGVIESLNTQEPAFDKERFEAELAAKELELKQMEIATSNQLKGFQLQSDERIQVAKLQQDSQVEGIKNQLEQFKLQMSQGDSVAQLQLAYATLNAEISKAQQELQLKSDALMVELRKVADKKEADQFSVMVSQQLEPQRLQLEAYKLQIDQAELQLRQQDQALKAQEQQFQSFNSQVDNMRQEMRFKLDAATLAHEMNKKPEIPPITINMPQPVSTKKKIKIERDEFGNLKSAETLDMQDGD